MTPAPPNPAPLLSPGLLADMIEDAIAIHRRDHPDAPQVPRGMEQLPDASEARGPIPPHALALLRWAAQAIRAAPDPGDYRAAWEALREVRRVVEPFTKDDDE